MTSNIGSHHLLDGITERAVLTEAARERVSDDLKAHFLPEFLNRVDDVVMFKPLSAGEIEQIVCLIVDQLDRRLSGQGLGLSVDKDALGFIAEEGFDPVYGARPLKRFVQHTLESRIGRAIIAGDASEGDRIRVDLSEGALAVRIESASGSVRGAA